VAIKQMSLQYGGLRNEQIVTEVLIGRDMRHPNIVSCLDSYLVGDTVWVVMEFMDGGTLASLAREVVLEEGEIAAVCRE
ncbi:Serine/threonine-protein kinase PAK 3, partial [Acanthisitta chloris]